MPCRPTRASQRGAAIVTALLVVTLAVTIVSGLLWRQQIQVRSVENQRLGAQAGWIFTAALDYARLVLRDDLRRSETDYLGEVWAVPIAETRLSDFLGATLRTDSASETSFLSGRILDAEARFNLTNLVNMQTLNGERRSAGLNADMVEAYRRLLTLLNLNPDLADVTANAVQEGFERTSPGDQSNAVRPARRPLSDLRDLLAVSGYTPETLRTLEPFAIVLPHRSTVNANTAPAEIMSAMIDGLNLAAARTLVSQRDRAHYNNLADLQNQLRAVAPQLEPGSGAVALDVRSRHFLVYGLVRHERAERLQVALVNRTPANGTSVTRILWIRQADSIPP